MTHKSNKILFMILYDKSVLKHLISYCLSASQRRGISSGSFLKVKNSLKTKTDNFVSLLP